MSAKYVFTTYLLFFVQTDNDVEVDTADMNPTTTEGTTVQLWPPAGVPPPFYHEDFEDVSDLQLFNSPSQVAGQVSQLFFQKSWLPFVTSHLVLVRTMFSLLSSIKIPPGSLHQLSPKHNILLYCDLHQAFFRIILPMNQIN